jgi:hypothetical protein
MQDTISPDPLSKGKMGAKPCTTGRFGKYRAPHFTKQGGAEEGLYTQQSSAWFGFVCESSGLVGIYIALSS